MTNWIIGILIALIVTTIPLVAVAKRLNISYPVVLIVAGLFLGFIPGLPEIWPRRTFISRRRISS